MARNLKFTVRLDEHERRKIVDLGKQLQRSQSDSLRFLLRTALGALAMPRHDKAAPKGAVPKEECGDAK